ncbi:Alpha/beta hydrolase fold-1 [Mycena sanguinolenta]|nr:Alpha/beta hydrolase fold-1 [Mycena sanguinolenta]
MAPNPTFVLVPGAAHGPPYFESLVAALNAKGYPTEVILNPSVGPLAGTVPPMADVTNLRQILEELVNTQQKEVVLMCHSYGGMVGSQSVNGLEKSAARKGGISKVVFLSAILPLEGEGSIQTVGASGFVSRGGHWLQSDATKGIMTPQKSVAAGVLYHDLVESQAQHWAAKLEPVALNVSVAPASNVCWASEVPKVYIFCKKDRSLPLEVQQKMLERVQMENKDSWKLYEMDCGHSPFLSHVEELVDILVKQHR